MKATLTVFFDHEGVVHHEFVPEGQKIAKEYYIKTVCKSRDRARRKWPELGASGD